MKIIKNIKESLRKHHLLKLIISFILLILVTFYNNPKVKENIFYFIETNVFYREIPPVYTNQNFKNTEPNSICSIMTKDKLITNSYSRSKYFNFSCETGILVSSNSDWSLQYLATGKIFNIETVVLKMKIIKPDNKYDSAIEFFNYTDNFLMGLGIYNVPQLVKQNILGLKDFHLKLDKNITMKYYTTENEIILILN